jgi:large subunit ribosomal protein L32e
MTQQDPRATKKALELRRQMKHKKPNFVRSESWRYVRIKENWRRPRGLDHKMRIKYDGWPPGVSVGYGGPKGTRGLHPSGYREVLAYNVEGLKGIDPKTQAIRIGHTVGKRKRAKIIVEAKKKRITVLNAKEVIQKEEGLTEEKLEEEQEKTEAVQPSKPEPRQGKTKKRKEEKREQ